MSKNRNYTLYKEGEYPYNLIASIVDESVRELDLPSNFTEDHLAGIEYAITLLEEREQTILRQRYLDKLTLTQISQNFKFSPNRASQIVHKILRKLRTPPLLIYIKYGIEGYKNKKAEFEENEKKKSSTEKVMETNLHAIDLSVRSFNNLVRAGYEKVGDLVSLTEEDIQQIKHMGKKQLAEVAFKLHSLGLPHTAWKKYLS